jgi:uncharacterized membrane protein
MTAETTTSPVIPKIRFAAIDRFRGYSTFYMIIWHTLMFWALPQEQYIVGISMLFTEVMGANAFILIAGINMSLSYQNYARKVQANPVNALREKWNGRFQIWIRTGWLVVLSCVYNAAATAFGGGLTLWVWLVLQTMFVARIVIYPFLQLPAWVRLSLGCCIFLLADPIRFWSMTQAPILYNILFYQASMNPFFPFVGFFFIGSAMGSWLDQWAQGQMGGKKPSEQQSGAAKMIQKYFTPKNLAYLGLIFFSIGILSGWQSEQSDLTPFLVSIINVHPTLQLDALPGFLVHSNTPWSFFSVGCEMIIFAAFWRADISKMAHKTAQIPQEISKNTVIAKPADKKVVNGLTLFGQQSLTVFLSQYAFSFFFVGSLIFWQWIIAAITLLIGFYTLIWIWANGKGKGYTIDWVVATSSTLLSKKLVRRFFPDEKKPEVTLITA